MLEAQSKEIELKKEQLRPVILRALIESSVTKMETPFGSFAVQKRKKWEYPESVLEIGEEFKAAKAKAESTGDATFTEEEGLRFTIIKL